MKKIARYTVRIAALVMAASLGGAALAADTASLNDRVITPDDVARGAYLVRIMSCTDCHTPGHFLGRPDMAMYLAGTDIGFAVPGLGYFYGPNLTPDDETGLGRWTIEDIVAALRTGARPDGRMLAPVMPWMGYAALTDDDAVAIAAYLKSMPAIRNAAPPPTGWDQPPPAGYHQVVMPPATP